MREGRAGSAPPASHSHSAPVLTCSPRSAHPSRKTGICSSPFIRKLTASKEDNSCFFLFNLGTWKKVPFKGNGFGCGFVQLSWFRALEEGVGVQLGVSCACPYGDSHLRRGCLCLPS